MCLQLFHQRNQCLYWYVDAVCVHWQVRNRSAVNQNVRAVMHYLNALFADRRVYNINLLMGILRA